MATYWYYVLFFGPFKGVFEAGRIRPVDFDRVDKSLWHVRHSD